MPPLVFSRVYIELEKEEARVYMEEALKINLSLSLEGMKIREPSKNPAQLQREIDALSKAGFSAKAPGAVP